jgi:hypothetical protein
LVFAHQPQVESAYSMTFPLFFPSTCSAAIKNRIPVL